MNYTPQGAAVAVDAGLVVSDAESATLAGATVAISAGFLAGDTLNFTNQNGIAGSYNASTGVLTLTGSASLANYQAALEFDHLQLDQRQSVEFGYGPEPDGQLDGDRRHAVVQYHHQHDCHTAPALPFTPPAPPPT